MELMMALGCLICINAFILLLVGFLAGKQKKMEEAQSLSLIASLWATSAAQGLKQSTVIQRVVERYHPGSKLTEKELAEMEKQFEELVGDEPEKPVRKRGVDIETYDFDKEFPNEKELV